MLYNYSVTALAADHFEERCRDIIEAVKSKAVSIPLFLMKLVPEGNPLLDKVTKPAELYARYRDVLEKEGVDCGILIQASLGHGYTLIPNPFQMYVNLTDGEEKFTCCPEDENFINHFCDVLKTIARERPKAIMLDDDFRLMMRPGRGCACPLHMKEFNKRTGLNMTREQLAEHILSHDDELTDVFRDIQRDSLVNAAAKFREAIDSIDSTIQGINCTSGVFCESAADINKIFAGKGNPTIVRMPDGWYSPFGVREFSGRTYTSAVCFSKLKSAGIDIVLSETDTIPFNRYAKSASHLHTQYSSAILQGAQGAKHWINRLTAYEPDSGKAYRKVLSENYGFYEKLSQYAKEIKWAGCNQVFTVAQKMNFAHKNIYHQFADRDAWVTKMLERMGIPFWFSQESSAANFLNADVVNDMTDEQIGKLFEGSVFVDGDCAQLLVQRGYSQLLGVDVAEWDLDFVSAECFDIENDTCCTKQKNLKKLTVLNDKTKPLSYNCFRRAGKLEILAPAVTVFRRDNGKISVVYCGTPAAAFDYMQGFAFLNESRKQQFIELLKEADALPVYSKGDDEVCLRAGSIPDGRLFVYVCKIGIDPLDSLNLYLEKEPKNIHMLCGNGEEKPVSFEARGNNFYEINQKAETMRPLVLLIENK